jgi:hypothetical protein
MKSRGKTGGEAARVLLHSVPLTSTSSVTPFNC